MNLANVVFLTVVAGLIVFLGVIQLFWPHDDPPPA